MTILLIAAGFVATGVFIGLFATATAPVGYEDETGFHFGNEQGETASHHEAAAMHHFSPKPA